MPNPLKPVTSNIQKNKTTNKMKKQLFTYYDSEAGQQTNSFTSLHEIVRYIEDFGWHGDSEGVVYADNKVILNYTSKEDGIFWG